MLLKHSADENPTEKSCPDFKDILQNFITTWHIHIDISGNSASISVEYSYLHILCHQWMFCVNIALFVSKLMEPYVNKHTYIHTYMQHSASYSKKMMSFINHQVKQNK